MADNREDLVELIKANPGATFMIDNDCWWMLPKQPKPDAEMLDADWDEWQETKLADDGTIKRIEGGGNCHGADVLQALAQIVGVKVEGV